MSEHELWNELGNLYFMSGAYDQAVHSYLRSIAIDKKYGRAFCNLAFAYVQKGKSNEAISLYERGVEMLTDPHEKALTWSKLGDVYRNLKDYRNAVKAYEWADVLDPDVRRSLGSSHQADVLLNRKTELDEVLALIERDADSDQIGKDLSTSISDPNLSHLLEELTPWSFDTQVPPPEDAALNPLFDKWFSEEFGVTGYEEAVLSTEPLEWKPKAEAGDLPVVNGGQLVVEKELNDDQAEVIDRQNGLESELDYEIEMQQEIDTDSVELESTGFDKESVEAAVFIEQANPDELTVTDPVLLDPADQVLIPELSPEQKSAIELQVFRYQRMVEINPHNHEIWGILGGLYKSSGRFDEAVDAYQRAISIGPDNAEFHYHLGLVFAAQKQIDDAISNFRQVIEIDPEHGLAHAALGGNYRKLGDEELAQSHIDTARSLMSDEEDEYNLACMEAICGNKDRAFELLEIALKNKQTGLAWVQQDPDLDFIRSDPRFTSLLVEYSAVA